MSRTDDGVTPIAEAHEASPDPRAGLEAAL
jgi:hypothetical protein